MEKNKIYTYRFALDKLLLIDITEFCKTIKICCEGIVNDK